MCRTEQIHRILQQQYPRNKSRLQLRDTAQVFATIVVLTVLLKVGVEIKCRLLNFM